MVNLIKGDNDHAFQKGEHAQVRVKVFTHFAKPGVWNAGKYYISYIHDHKLIRQNVKNNSIIL